MGTRAVCSKSEVFRAVLDEVYLPVQIAFEILLAYVELENEGLSGPARNERRIQPLDGGDQGIVTIIQATVGIDSGSDGHEAGIQRYALSGFRPNCQPGHPGGAIGHGLNFAIQDVRAFLDRFTQQKPIEARRSAAPPAGQRAPEYGVHPHVFGNSQPEVLPLALYPDVVEAPLDDLVGNGEALLLEYLVQSGRDAARAEAASPALKAGGAQVDRTTLLNDDDLDAPIETPGFPKKMDGKERTGRSTADDGNAVVVLEAPPLRRCAAHGLSPFGKDVRSVGGRQKAVAGQAQHPLLRGIIRDFLFGFPVSSQFTPRDGFSARSFFHHLSLF